MAGRGLTIGVVIDALRPTSIYSLPGGGWMGWTDELTEELHEQARAAAILPMTGQTPDWSEGQPADAVRRAGLTYLDRVTG